MSDLFIPAPEPKSELGRHRVLSRNAGVKVSPLALGAMSVGSAWEGMMGSMSKEQSFKLLDAFHDLGGNWIDTASNYQNEESESWLGEWMASRKNRDEMFIATKFTTQYRSWELGKGPRVSNYSGNSKKTLHISVRDSLRKLQTDYIDLLYIHWWDYTTSIEELMDSLHILVQQGKVLYLGVSDTPAWIVSAANTYALAHGKTPFSVYQGRWNLVIRDFEREIIPMARQFGLALCPWDVLGGGRFQTKKAIEERQAAGEKLRTFVGGEQTEEEARVSAALEKVAKEHGTENITQIALAYVLHKAPGVPIFPMVGGRKVEHLEQNIGALSIFLTDEQVKELDEVKPFEIGFPQNFIGEDPRVTGQDTPLAGGSAKLGWDVLPKRAAPK